MLTDIQSTSKATQAQFDEWHRRACEELRIIYGEALFVGQAQKWVNMAFKYIFVMGEERRPGFRHLYDLCHVPLDSIVLRALQDRGLPPLACAWSRLDCYDTYLDRQKWVRDHFDLAPLNVEFRLWMGNSWSGKDQPLPRIADPTMVR